MENDIERFLIFLVEELIPCKHDKWLGIPEVDAYCARCGLDEFQVNQEREIVKTKLTTLYTRFKIFKEPPKL